MRETRRFRTIGAVALSAAVGLGFSTSAHALYFVQNAADNPTDVSVTNESKTVTYAKETLLKGTGIQPAAESADNTMYYNIERDHYVSVPPGVASISGDTYVLIYTLEGMVFAAPDSGMTVAAPSNGFTLQSGGAAGDKEVVFRANASTAVIANTTLALTAKFAVSEGGGSVTLLAENRTFGGMKTHGPARVMVKSALKVTAIPTVPAPQAKSANGFMNFGGSASSPLLGASLGTFEVGVVSPNLENAQGTTNTAADIVSFMDITAVAATNGSVANPVTFSVEGGFGFVKTLALAADCTGGTLTEIRKAVTPATTPATYTDETTPQEAQNFEPDDGDRVLQHLCIEVDGETTIPKTAPFVVMAKYKGLENAAFPPMATASNLAAITRDGTQFNIPYLTDSDKLKQRITIQNRGRASTWSLTNLETIGDSVMALPGMDEGDLPIGQTVIKVWEHIEVMGAARASGSITIPITSTAVSASTDMVNPESGGVATTTLTAE